MRGFLHRATQQRAERKLMLCQAWAWCGWSGPGASVIV